jgi:hypothetical protein
MRLISLLALIMGFYYQASQNQNFIDYNLKPTVQIVNLSKTTTGSAVVIKSDKIADNLYYNIAFSCEHVMSPKVNVITYKYKRQRFSQESDRLPAMMLATNKDDDVSILAFFSNSQQATCKTDYTNDVNLLDEVTAVGCGLSEHPRFTEGKITGIGPDQENMSFIRTTVPLVPGDSGCGLYNKQKYLIGISNSIRKMEHNGMQYPVEGISGFKPLSLLKKNFDSKKFDFVFKNKQIPPIAASYLWLLSSEFQY